MPDLIPAARAELHWRDGARDMPERLTVIDLHSGSNPVTGATRRHVEHFDNSAGATIAGWMTGADPIGGSPEAFLATEVLDRSADRAAIKAALVALGQIEECDWARKMVAALDEIEQRRA